MEQYVKAVPDATYQELEQGLRGQEFTYRLVALEKPIMDTYTVMDLQGQLDRKFTVSVQTSLEPRRKKDAEMWPKSVEENFERLANCGIPVDRQVPKCLRCNGRPGSFSTLLLPSC